MSDGTGSAGFLTSQAPTWIAHNPETPEGRAQRFIVLRYPDHVNLEGFVYQHCASGCAPGAVALHRLYSAARHDTVVVPSSEVAAMLALGYAAPTDPALPEVVG